MRLFRECPHCGLLAHHHAIPKPLPGKPNRVRADCYDCTKTWVDTVEDTEKIPATSTVCSDFP